MNVENPLNKEQLVSLYENAIISNQLPDKEVTEKIISLRASLSQSSSIECFAAAESNVINKIKDTFTMISLGTTDENSSLRNLNADVINTLFKNAVSTSLSASRNLYDWNEGLNSLVESQRAIEMFREDMANEPTAVWLVRLLNERMQSIFR